MLKPKKVPLRISTSNPEKKPNIVASSFPLFKPIKIKMIIGISGAMLYWDIEINQINDF